jgi:threonylcarbamoyladenosine tRNA methylthiotransferase MtaB
MAEASYRLVDDAGLTHLHVFPYSIRPGTPAARMPQVEGAVIKARAARLREKGKAAMAAWLQGRIGTTVQVLRESDGSGRSEHYAPVKFDSEGAAGEIVTARVISASPDTLFAEALQ